MTDKQIICKCNDKECGQCSFEEQLKAKEQECERLDADNIYLRDRVGKLERAILRRNEQLDQLKAENENWQKEYWKLEQGNDFLAETNSRLKQNLTEIKEIAKNGCYDDCGMPLDELSIILQKISECEGN